MGGTEGAGGWLPKASKSSKSPFPPAAIPAATLLFPDIPCGPVVECGGWPRAAGWLLPVVAWGALLFPDTLAGAFEKEEVVEDEGGAS
jgi:hypothetical protein